jgi:hypothetical protein
VTDVGPLNTRHLDAGVRLWEFADEVLVLCARCNRPGRVVRSDPTEARRFAFECVQCGLTLDSARHDWVGPITYTGRRPCGTCGHKWLAVRIAEDRYPHEARRLVSVRCPGCLNDCQVSADAEPARPDDRCIDPHFGLPLLLAAPTRHGRVWAYNLRHLRELRAYIAAMLRERRGTGNSSMYSRLPPWMKAAKHRDEMLKAIDRLEAVGARP